MKPLALFLPAVLLLACATHPDDVLGRGFAPESEPVVETRRTMHSDGETVQVERTVLVHANGRVERHGPEHEWYADGTPRSERFFEHDRPTGIWSSWYENGTKRSEVEFGDGVHPAPMRFWHSNGRLAGEGYGIAGVKDGPWSYWNEDGVKLREGGYNASVRDGLWTFWYAGGGKRAEGTYAGGLRVGEWRLWDRDGELVVRQASAELPGR